MNTKSLTAKQQAFIQEYLIDWNATRAAIRAGYAENSARQEGTRLLSNAYVSATLREKKRELMEKMDLKAEDVIYDLVRLKDMCIKLDEKGEPQDAANAVKCLAYLGNNLGLWKKEPFEDGGVELVIKRADPPRNDEPEADTPRNVAEIRG